MENIKNRKIEALIKSGCEPTGKYYTVLSGLNKGKKFPIYATKGDIGEWFIMIWKIS